MSKIVRHVLFSFFVVTLTFGLTVSTANAKKYLAFGGGPVGGTFQYFANAMALLIQKNVPDVSVASEGTGGSAENLKRMDRGDIDFGIVYMGDAYLGRQGKLPQDVNKYENLRAVSYLYGAPAQLVVRADSGIKSAKDLVGKRVAVGNAGSGAAIACERFFTQLGIWDKIDRQFLGYSPAASAFNDKKIDAFWLLVGYPNSSVIEASTGTKINLVNIAKEANDSGFYKVYPFYAPAVIPANVYAGQTAEVDTFNDGAWWMANKNVDEDTVYKALKAVYSTQGLKTMVETHKAATEMTIANALDGLVIQLHPGAVKFWKEQGLTIPKK